MADSDYEVCLAARESPGSGCPSPGITPRKSALAIIRIPAPPVKPFRASGCRTAFVRMSHGRHFTSAIRGHSTEQFANLAVSISACFPAFLADEKSLRIFANIRNAFWFLHLLKMRECTDGEEVVNCVV
jgi:hypothetical protein